MGRGTTHAGRTALAVALLGAALAGCGSDGSEATLELVVPEADALLTVTNDDVDPQRAGLQVDVEGRSHGLAEGTSVKVFQDEHEELAGQGRIDAQGMLSIPAVTLAPGTHRLYLETLTGSASSDKDQRYTLKALRIDAPEDGTTLTTADDEDGARDGVQVSVTVSAFAFDEREDITLLLDGDELETRASGASGELVFAGVTLRDGLHRLKAASGDGDGAITSEEISVQVRQSCAQVTFIEPLPPPPGDVSVTLGGASCPDPASGAAFVTRVVISTDVGDGRTAILLLDGAPFQAVRIDGTMAVFEDVALTHFSGDNHLAIDVPSSQGASCVVDFPGELLVDCAGSDCTLSSPTPVAYVDANAELGLYLNAAQRTDGGFDIQVTSGAELDGRTIQLIVDGDGRNPLSATAVLAGAAASATFAGVALDDGEHTLQGLCIDAGGNITTTGVVRWNVDTAACGVSITDPQPDTLFVPADDEDNASAGTQVIVSGAVSGDDCVRQRSKPCDPGTGIEGADFVAWGGTSPLLSPVTLDADASAQTLCVEVEDRAGNIGRGTVSVRQRTAPPEVALESPQAGAAWNSSGAGPDYEGDADLSTPAVCDADFMIACSELGVEVELHRDTAAGVLLGSAECQTRQSGDPPLRAGFAGRAKLRAPFSDDDDMAVLVATQAASGGSGALLVGASPALALLADCRAPELGFAGDPCAEAASNQLSLAQAAARDVGVQDASADIVSASLQFTNDGGGNGTLVPSSTAHESAAWDAVNLGGVGTVTLTASAADDFGNTASVECTTAVVADLPAITAFTAPVDMTVFGPGDGCDPGTTAFGVRVLATIDTDANRTASVLVDGAEVVSDAAISGAGGIDECVPVPDELQDAVLGPSAITLRIDSDLGAGFAEQTRSVRVHTLAFATPAPGAVLVASDNCAGVGFGVPVVVDVDPIHVGRGYTLSAGSGSVTGSVTGAQISGCVPLAAGPNTITASLDGTSLAYSVNVTVQ